MRVYQWFSDLSERQNHFGSLTDTDPWARSQRFHHLVWGGGGLSISRGEANTHPGSRGEMRHPGLRRCLCMFPYDCWGVFSPQPKRPLHVSVHGRGDHGMNGYKWNTRGESPMSSWLPWRRVERVTWLENVPFRRWVLQPRSQIWAG